MQIFTFCSSLPPSDLALSYRELCGVTAFMDAAAIRYLGSRSPENLKEEQHPTPPPLPPPPFLRSDTLLWPPCRGRTWSRQRLHSSSLSLPLPPALQRTGVDLITLPLVCSHSLLPQRIQQGHCVPQRPNGALTHGWSQRSVIEVIKILELGEPPVL